MIDNRFTGIARLYGEEGFARIQQAHIAVVGIGGVGTWVAEALARTGVGELTLIDLDDICLSNTNRQLHTLQSTIGKSKVEVMAERIKQINPACQIHALLDFISRETIPCYIHNDLDGVVDCIDSVQSKAALIAWCKRRKISIVTTGGAGGQLDPTQIQVIDLNKTFNDPLAAKVRSLLRREYGFSKTASRHYSVPCVFSTEQLRYPQADGSVCQSKVLMANGTKLDCAGGFGAVSMVTASFGMVAASKIIDKIVAGARRPSAKLASS